MAELPIYHDGFIHVMARMCKSCVFKPGNPMDLDEGRLEGLIRENLDADAALPCHSSVYELHGQHGQTAVCKGFFDRYSSEVVPLRAARIFKIIKEVEP